jgi:hypothetical protein
MVETYIQTELTVVVRQYDGDIQTELTVVVRQHDVQCIYMYVCLFTF